MSRSPLSPDQEADIQKLNQMTQQLRTLQSQHVQYKSQADEMNKTIEVMKTFEPEREIYRQAGQVLFKADVTETLKELQDKYELIEIRVKQLGKQYEDYEKATKELDSKIRGYLNV